MLLCLTENMYIYYCLSHQINVTPPQFLGHKVAQLVEALCYKLEGCGFDSRWCHWNFSLT
jgi:hypothetical protein